MPENPRELPSRRDVLALASAGTTLMPIGPAAAQPTPAPSATAVTGDGVWIRCADSDTLVVLDPAGLKVETTINLTSFDEDAMHTAAPTGDPDRDFLAMMIPHHEEALAMPHLMLLRGRDPLKLQLAQEITAGQSIEISTMRARLAALQSQAEEYPTLGGTRGFARSPG